MDEMTCLRCDGPLAYLGRFEGRDLFECADCVAGHEVAEGDDLALAA